MANQNKVAVVTGGGRGIGLGIALELARGGFDLAINGRNDAANVREAIDSLQKLGASTAYFQADISQTNDRQQLIEQVRQHFGRLDVLVNNAGVAPLVRADILEASVQSFDRLIDINLKGPYFLTQIVAKWMIQQRQTDANFRGCIVNISSVSATVVSVNRGEYCVAKAGVAMATQLWAARLAEFGIDVYEVRPGIVESDMTATMKEKYDKLIADGLTVQRRWGQAADVGRAVAMLARGDLSYAPGQVLVVDGGLTLARL